ncbi:MAG TPA: hypothetical protein VK063_03115 [Beutenbergiaceae bacterium]|nr:hypothetical protein [Beutenbergiaceae bacterium]
MWFAIWAVLIVGALAFFAYLGWRLWRRSIRPLLEELGRAAEVTGDLAAKVAELQQAHADPVFSPDIMASDAEREVFSQRRHDIRSARAERKQARRDRAFARWRQLGQPF